MTTMRTVVMKMVCNACTCMHTSLLQIYIADYDNPNISFLIKIFKGFHFLNILFSYSIFKYLLLKNISLTIS